MNQAIKHEWLAALRSGDYKQDQGKLVSSHGYCCLGVLCDLHAKANNGEWDYGKYKGYATLLPPEVSSWAGLPIAEDANENDGSDVEVARTWRNYDSLVDMNDDGCPFLEIADVIEEQL